MSGIRLSPIVLSAVMILAVGSSAAVFPGSAASQQELTGSAMEARLARLHRAGDYDQAVALIGPALERDSDNHTLLCDMADNLTDWARIMEDEKEQEARYEEAVAFALLAVAADSSSAQGWFQYGKAYGRLALFKGGKTKVNMSREVKVAFEKAIEIDPRHAGSLHGLARWHREVANLSWLLKTAAKIIYGGLPPASNEEAVRLFEQAIEIEPDSITHHLELGKTWLEMKEKEKARAEFELVLALPEGDAEDPEWKVEAEELMKKTR